MKASLSVRLGEEKIYNTYFALPIEHPHSEARTDRLALLKGLPDASITSSGSP